MKYRNHCSLTEPANNSDILPSSDVPQMTDLGRSVFTVFANAAMKLSLGVKHSGAEEQSLVGV